MWHECQNVTQGGGTSPIKEFQEYTITRRFTSSWGRYSITFDTPFSETPIVKYRVTTGSGGHHFWIDSISATTLTYEIKSTTGDTDGTVELVAYTKNT